MKRSDLVLTEHRASAPELPFAELIRQAVTLWLTKELSK